MNQLECSMSNQKETKAARAVLSANGKCAMSGVVRVCVCVGRWKARNAVVVEVCAKCVCGSVDSVRVGGYAALGAHEGR